jgi:hypothetical protein
MVLGGVQGYSTLPASVSDPDLQNLPPGSGLKMRIRIQRLANLLWEPKVKAFFKQILTKTDTERSMAQLDKYVGNRQYKV